MARMEQHKASIAAVVKNIFDVTIEVELARPGEQFGDYSTNAALQLAKPLARNPREIADQLADALREALAKDVSEVSVAAPGFINLRLSDAALWRSSQRHPQAKYQNQKIVIETNNPNPFKDMHIGHAYNCVTADTIANLLEVGGGDIHRVSYHGDVGRHVGMSMWAILKEIDNDLTRLSKISETDRPAFMSRMYQAGVAAYEADETVKEEILRLAKLSFSLDDPLYKQVYETCKAWSFAYFDRIFAQLGSQPIERRYLEREADAAGRQAVESRIGTVFEKSGGAIIFPGEKYGLHTRVFISSRGTTLYEARDLGLIQLKAADFKPNASYIVTAVEQQEYFKVVLKAAELALPDLAGTTHNISTAMVKLSSGKMSSRKGTFINIGWLIEAITKALIARGGQDAGTPEAIVGAIRYALLKNRLGSDVIIDINEAISLDGNSGPYLQYAHARACSILRNVKMESEKWKMESGLETGERSLVRKISEYPETVEKAVAELMPHHICTYLYELAQTFNRFYEHSRVIGDPRQDIRLNLVKTYATTIKNGLNLMGIPAPERM
jgi:arginyl-tRNA synthetase